MIAIRKGANSSKVYDFDVNLDFPCEFSVYASACLRINIDLPPHYQRYSFLGQLCLTEHNLRVSCRMFRVVSAEEYLQNFASDRSRKFALLAPRMPPHSLCSNRYALTKWRLARATTNIRVHSQRRQQHEPATVLGHDRSRPWVCWTRAHAGAVCVAFLCAPPTTGVAAAHSHTQYLILEDKCTNNNEQTKQLASDK